MELYKIFAIMNRAIKGLHCIYRECTSSLSEPPLKLSYCWGNTYHHLTRIITKHKFRYILMDIWCTAGCGGSSWHDIFLWHLFIHNYQRPSLNAISTHKIFLLGILLLSFLWLWMYPFRLHVYPYWEEFVDVFVSNITEKWANGILWSFQDMDTSSNWLNYFRPD